MTWSEYWSKVDKSVRLLVEFGILKAKDEEVAVICGTFFKVFDIYTRPKLLPFKFLQC